MVDSSQESEKNGYSPTRIFSHDVVVEKASPSSQEMVHKIRSQSWEKNCNNETNTIICKKK